MDKAGPVVILTAFYKPFSSGAELCVEEMVKHRGERELVIVTSRLSRKSPKLDADAGVKIVRVGFGYPWDKFLYPFFCVWPTLKLKPAIAHAVMESYAGIGLVLVKWLKPSLKTVLTLQSGNLDVDPKLMRWPLAWIWKKIHTVPDRITAVSNFLAARAVALRGSDRDVTVIPNGVDLSIVPRTTYNVQRTEGRVVCISRLSREKGVDVLIKAFAKVASEVAASELHVVGDGPDREFVENLIAENSLQNRVKLYGRQPHDEAIRIVSTGQVFALLSRGEGQGIVLLEAASAGLPCVATNVGGIPEAVMDGETGYLVPNEDADAAAARILELLKDSDLRERMGQAAEKFAQGFEWSACINAYLDLWQKMQNKLNVVIATGIYPPDIGGPAKYVERLKDGLMQRGHTVSVIAYADAASDARYARHGLVTVSRKIFLPIRLFCFAHAIWKRLKGADAVYAQGPISDGLPALLAAKIRGKAFVLKTVGDYAWEQYMNNESAVKKETLEQFITHTHNGKIGLLERIERFVAKRADAVISPSEYFKSAVLRSWGVDLRKVEVVRNGVEGFSKIVEAETQTAASIPSPGLGGADLTGKKIIFTAGRAIALKRVDYLISLLPDLPNHILAIAGDGPCLSFWKAKAQDFNVSDRVLWLGRLDRESMSVWYSKSDVFALASVHETFPHVLIEAAGHGLPCVASKVGGIPEIAEAFPDLIAILPTDDRSAWIEALSVAKRRNEGGLPDCFSLERMIDSTEHVLRSTIKI